MAQLVGLIYTSAGDANRTAHLLSVLAGTLGGTVAHLFLRDLATGAVLHSQMGDPRFGDANRRYARDWGSSDPRVQWLASRPSGQVLLCHEQFDQEFVQASKFHRNFLSAHGLRWSITAKFASAPGIESFISVLRAPDLPRFEGWTVATLEQLVPQFEQAAGIQLKLERQAAAVHAATEVLRRLPSPCLFSDQAGRCLEGNEAFGRAMEGMSLHLVTGRVRFADATLQARWESALFEVHTTAAPCTMDFIDPAQRAWTAHLIPWLPLSGQGDAFDKWVILVVFDEKVSESRAQLQPGSMASTARLTRAEVEVLAGLLKGLPAKAIASRRSASVNTVRSQIVAILEKTGFKSQKELMASFSTSALPESVFSNSAFDSHAREPGAESAVQLPRFPQAWPSSTSGPRL